MRSTDARRVLGIDPSLNRTGWAVIEQPLSAGLTQVAGGVLAPRPGSRAERLLEIKHGLEYVLDQHKPQEAYIESPGAWQRRGGTRRETLEVLGMARGVMLTACAEARINPIEAHFTTVRSALLGRANPRAQEMIDFIDSEGLPVPCRPRGGCDFDIVNAILMALYGLSRGEVMH